MMAVKLLVKIAVMMMAPGGTSAPPEARGREPPSFFFLFLDLLPRWEKGFPSGPWPPWRGRGESPSEIGSVSLSLSVSAFLDVAFHRFVYIWRSVTPIGLKPSLRFFFPKISFLAAKVEQQPPYRGPTRVRGAPLPRGHLGHRLALILPPIFSKYSKNILRPFSRLDSV